MWRAVSVPTRILLGLAPALLGALARPAPAQASCVLPPSRVIWSSPADGEVGVGTNARVFVMTSSYGELEKITVNGQPVFRAIDGSFGFPAPLTPSARHEVRIAANNPADPPLSFTFTTAAGPTPVPAPVAPQVSRLTALSSRPLSETCTAAWEQVDCYDTGQNSHLVFETTVRPLLFLIERRNSLSSGRVTKLWPGACGDPEVYTHERDGTTCGGDVYRIGAVDLTGAVLWAAAPCNAAPDAGAPDVSVADAGAVDAGIADARAVEVSAPVDVAASDAAVTETKPADTKGGCSIGGGAPPASPLLALLFAAVVFGRRASRS
jgi:hypothetical protein